MVVFRYRAGRGRYNKRARLPEHTVLAEIGLDRARSLEDAVEIVAQRRGRPIEIVDRRLDGGINGMWLALEDRDQIVINSNSVFVTDHRDHVIAHELMHALEASTGTEPGCTVAHRSRYDDPTEYRVESLACALMVSIRASGGVGPRLSAMGTFR